MGKDTMKAVVFKGPGKVVIEDRPVPKIQDPTDIIVKVEKVYYLVQKKCRLLLTTTDCTMRKVIYMCSILR
jgi:hypothetical protein